MNLKLGKIINNESVSNDLILEKSYGENQHMYIMGPLGSGKINLSLLPYLQQDIINKERTLLITNNEDIIQSAIGMALMNGKDMRYYDFNSKEYYLDMFTLKFGEDKVLSILLKLFNEFATKKNMNNKCVETSIRFLKESVHFLMNARKTSLESLHQFITNRDYFYSLFKNLKVILGDEFDSDYHKLKKYHEEESLIVQTLPLYMFMNELLSDETISNSLTVKNRKDFSNINKNGLVIINTKNIENNKHFALLMNIFMEQFLLSEQYNQYNGYNVYIENIETLAPVSSLNHLIKVARRHAISLKLFGNSMNTLEKINSELANTIKTKISTVGILPLFFHIDNDYIKCLLNDRYDVDTISELKIGKMTYFIKDEIHFVKNEPIVHKELMKINHIGKYVLKSI